MAVRFQFLEEYLDTISTTQREVVEELDRLIINSSGKIKFKFSYGLPFYEFIKNLCYINCKKTGEVDIGFWNGKDLHDIPGLEFNGRVMIKTFTYYHLGDINEEILIFTVQEALRIQRKVY